MTFSLAELMVSAASRVFDDDGEVLAIQELLLEVLDHACSEAAPWPAAASPATAPP